MKIKHALTLALALFAAAANAKDVYVSSSAGDDKNDGSLSAPLRTIAAAPKDGVNLFLKRGDVFFESLSGFKNSKIDAYGEGEKPLLCGLKILEKSDAWERLPDGVWRLDLTKHSTFSGFKADGEQNNIGAVYDIENDRLYGCLTRHYKNMRDTGDFWVSDAEKSEVSPKNNKFTHLFFKCPTHPSKLAKKIALLPYNFGIRNLRNCTVQNVAVKGFGAHGISKTWNCKFYNIDIDLIGGSILRSYKTWVRFGNGIEFWMSEGDPCNNNLVENCAISRTFDCGSTIQGHLGKKSRPKNIVFRKNKFLRCRQAFEHWTATVHEKSVYENCEFSDNIAFDSGFNEFDTPYTVDSSLLSYERKPVEGLTIRNNIMWGAPAYFSSGGNGAEFEGNVFYIFKKTYIYGTLEGKNCIPALSGADVENAFKKLGNAGGKFILVDRTDSAAREKAIAEHFSAMKDRIAYFDKNRPRNAYQRELPVRK